MKDSYVGDCGKCGAIVVDCCDQCERCIDCCTCLVELTDEETALVIGAIPLQALLGSEDSNAN